MGWASQLWNKCHSHAMGVTVMGYVRFELKHLWVLFLKETPVMGSVSQLWDRCHICGMGVTVMGSLPQLWDGSHSYGINGTLMRSVSQLWDRCHRCGKGVTDMCFCYGYAMGVTFMGYVSHLWEIHTARPNPQCMFTTWSPDFRKLFYSSFSTKRKKIFRNNFFFFYVTHELDESCYVWIGWVMAR